MKKVLSWVLLLTLIVSLFAGCKTEEVPETTAPTEGGSNVSQGDVEGITAALEYLKVMYKTTEEATPTPRDYQRLGIVRIGGVPYEVVWTTDLSEEMIQVVVNDDGTVTIKILQQPEEDIPYKLTATITDSEGNSVSHSWEMVLPKAVDMAAIVDAAYELGNGETLPYEATLTGKIISIDTVYDPDYQNITVTMVVEGKEDKPIKCYRLKGVGAENLMVGNIITVTGTIKNYNGTIEFDAGCILEAVEKGDAVEAPTDPGEILKAAYALKENQTLPYPAVLTGKVIAIDSPYDPNYGNISVIIEVEGYSQYPILCYRLKGLGVDQIAIEDIITVNGIIKNYKGTIEYDSGCKMIERISGGNIAEKPSSDPNKIIPDAMALAPGQSLAYRATLTGTIYSIDTPYSSQYNNITVTMVVNGYKFQCYRMVGDGIDQIRETDKITVSGIIKNYNGKIEFDAKCTLDAWEKGPRNVSYGPVKEGVAYALYMDQKTVGKTVYFNGAVSGNRLQTSDKGSKAIEVYGERVSGKGMRFYYMEGNAKKYIQIEEYVNNEGKVRGRAIVTDSPSCVWTYLNDMGVYVVSLPTAGKYFLGTYSSYETITASWSGYLESSSNPQYVAKFMEHSKVPVEEPATMIPEGTPVDAPAVGTAYKFGFYQNKLEGKPFLAFAGKMSGYYMATANVMADMTDVYLETAQGGYYIYFKNGNTKTYIDMIVRESDNTKVDIKLQTSGTHTVWKLNLEHKYVYSSLAGSEWYLGTFNTNNSISASKTSYISDTSTIGVSQFCAWFNNVKEVPAPEEEPDEPVVPDVPAADATLITQPVYGTAYKLGMNVNGKILYLTGKTTDVNYRLATSTDATKAADFYLEAVPGVNGGAYLYFMNGSTKTYVRMYHRQDGDPGFGKGSLELVTTAPSEYFGWSSDANTLIYDYDGNNAYYMGTYDYQGTIYDNASVSNTYYITGNKASTVDVSQFPVHFYTVEVSDTPVETTTEPSVTLPSIDDENALPVVMMSPDLTHAIKALDETANYGYMKTTAISTIEDLKVENVFILIDNGDEKTVKIMDCYGRYLYMTGTHNSVNVSSTLPAEGADWELTIADADKSLFYITNTLKNKTFGYDSGFGSYGVYAEQAKHTAICVALLDIEIEPDVTEPTTTEPPVTQPTPEAEATLVTNPGFNTAYKMAMDKKDGKLLYFNGQPESPSKTYRLATTENAAEAVDVYLENAGSGNVWLYFMNNGVKTYIRVFHYTDDAEGRPGFGKGSLEFVTSKPNETFVYDDTANTLFHVASDNDSYYMGTYGTYTTFSVSNTSYITGDKASNVDVSQFPARFYTVEIEDVPVVTDPPATEPPATEPPATEPGVSGGVETGKAYKWAIDQKNKGVTLYFAGTMNGYYGATTEDINNAVDVVLEAANGGYYVSFTDPSGAKKYINVVVSGTHRNFTIANAPASVYTYSAEHNTLLTDVDGTTCYIGTYGTYNTFSVSPIDKIGTSFPSYFVGVGGGVDPEPTDPPATEPPATEPPATEPGVSGGVETGKAYKWAIDQKNKGVTLYFAGTMNGYYGATTEDINNAVDVVLEAANGGYYVSFTDPSGAKKYINVVVSGTHRNFTIANAPASVYTYSAEHNTLLTDVDGTTCYIGTYGTYNTFSVSPIDKIGTSFPSYFVGVGGGVDPEPTDPPATEPPATEPPASEPTGNGYHKITSASQFTSGKYVMMVATGYAPGVYQSGWLSAVQPAVSGNTVTDPAGAVWTLTVNGNSVILTDSNGVAIAPKGGNYNGVIEGSYEWEWTFENGAFRFAGTGSDTVYLASNADTTGQYPGNHRFRGYKTTTCNNAATYPSLFTLYKLSDGSTTPDVSEPTVTNPPATEPPATNPPVSGDALEVVFLNPDHTMAMVALGTDKTFGYLKTTAVSSLESVTRENVFVLEEAGQYVYIKDCYGRYLYMTGTFNSVNLSNTVPENGGEWDITVVDESANTFYITNVLMNKTMGYDAGYGSYGVYPDAAKHTAICIAKVGDVEIDPPATEPPATEPPATEPPATEPGVSGGVETGKAYKWAIDQKNKGVTLYFAGTMNGYYGATTEDINNAVDVVLEAANGGYYVSFTDPSGAKKYINVVVSGTHRNFTIANAPASVYTYSAEHNTLLTDVDGTTCYIGTYGTYNTFSVSPIDKIGTSFPSYFVGVGGGVDPEPSEPTNPPATEPPATNPPADSNSVTYNFANYAEGTQYASEVRQLDDVVTISTSQCQIKNQLRIYQDLNYNANAVFASTKAIKSVIINAGYKVAGLEVYGSDDGVTWKLITTVNISSTTYGDYTVEMPAGTSYKYLKLDAVNAQVRVPYITFNFA